MIILNGLICTLSPFISIKWGIICCNRFLTNLLERKSQRFLLKTKFRILVTLCSLGIINQAVALDVNFTELGKQKNSREMP